jgi:hypothetical protein
MVFAGSALDKAHPEQKEVIQVSVVQDSRNTIVHFLASRQSCKQPPIDTRSSDKRKGDYFSILDHPLPMLRFGWLQNKTQTIHLAD